MLPLDHTNRCHMGEDHGHHHGEIKLTKKVITMRTLEEKETIINRKTDECMKIHITYLYIIIMTIYDEMMVEEEEHQDTMKIGEHQIGTILMEEKIETDHQGVF